MKNRILFLIYILLIGCTAQHKTPNSTSPGENSIRVDTLPPPFATPPVRNNSKVIGWPEGKTPVAPVGFTVTKFADTLQNPRWIYIGPNGDIFVSESRTGKNSANRITMFRDSDYDGKPELRETFLTGLKSPLGMLILGDNFYVGNTDALVVFPYLQGQTSITSEGRKILDLPGGGYNNHWTRNVISNADGSKIYVSVGSGSNVGEHGMDNEIRRANILEINPDGSGEQIYAAGLRNPVGMAWVPGTKTLWVAVNERDNLGDELVPDYITSVQRGAFYGWPFAYFGPNEDPRRKGERPDLVAKTTPPDIPLGSHTACLGIAFYEKNAFPSKYHNGAFVGQHGSWNSSQLVGYKVVFVPFKNGKPSGPPEDFLTGFIADMQNSQVYGRPVCVAVLSDGSMLVTDDASNTIWRITYNK